MKVVFIIIVNPRKDCENRVMVSAGLRATRQRTAVLALLGDTEDFRSAQELHLALRERGDSVGLTTVYRTLAALADSGELDVIRRSDGESLFRRCGSGEHHHHLVCRACGATIEVEGPAMEQWAERVAAKHGFTGVSHTLELFGTCPNCS